MRTLRAALCAAFLAAIASVLAFAAEIPTEVFLKDYEFDMLQLSPDGSKVAAVAAQGEARNLFIIDLATKKPRAISGFTDKSVAEVIWVGNERLLFTVSSEGFQLGGLFAVDADGKNFRALVAANASRGAAYLAPYGDSTKEVLVIANDRMELEPDVYRMNVANGFKQMVALNPGGVRHWVADSKGAVRAAFGEKDLERFVLFRDTANGEWREVRRTTFTGGSTVPLRFDADDRLIYVSSDVDTDTAGIYLFDPATGEVGAAVHTSDRYDISNVLVTRKGGKLLGVAYDGERPQVIWKDPELKKIQKLIDSELPGTRNTIYSRSMNNEWMVILASSDRDPGTFYLLNTKELSMETLVRRASWIDPKQMSEMRPISYVARDGLKIEGYLTLPAGKDPKNLPLIVNPHGGPWFRDSWGFNPEVQLLANRGYAVLQMNFRGSTGYGRKHLTLGYGQWGLTMQDDITDGVKWAIEQGYADPKRIGIYGASYGGYAAMAGVTNTPELYRCAVNYVGVTDIGLLLKTIPKSWESGRKQLQAMTGTEAERQANMERVSPLRNVEKIQVPLFLAYGELDERIDMKHVTRLIRELKKHNKKYEFMVRSFEGHGYVRPENKLAYYKALERFLKHNL